MKKTILYALFMLLAAISAQAQNITVHTHHYYFVKNLDVFAEVYGHFRLCHECSLHKRW